MDQLDWVDWVDEVDLVDQVDQVDQVKFASSNRTVALLTLSQIGFGARSYFLDARNTQVHKVSQMTRVLLGNMVITLSLPSCFLLLLVNTIPKRHTLPLQILSQSLFSDPCAPRSKGLDFSPR